MKIKHKICHVITRLDAGGVGKVTRTLAKEFVRQGHEVMIICLTNQSPPTLKTDIEARGIRVIEVDNNRMSAPASIAKTMQAFFALFKDHRDITHLICPGVNYASLAIPPAKILRHKTKIIVNAHTNFSAYAAGKGLAFRLRQKINRSILAKADRIANDSQGAADDLKTFFKLRRVDAIYNPITTPEDLAFKEKKADAPHEWLRDKSLLNFVSCGRFIESKNFGFMLDVFARVHAAHPHARLILIGKGPEEETLKAQVQSLGITDAVHFAGFVDDPKVYFYHADYFWLTSLYEGFSMVLGEALSMGTPCISNDCPSGPREVLEGGKYGLLIEDYDLAHNTSEILAFLKQERNSREFYRTRTQGFLISEIATQYLEP